MSKIVGCIWCLLPFGMKRMDGSIVKAKRPSACDHCVCRMCDDLAQDDSRYCSNSCDWGENGPPDSYWESYGSASDNAALEQSKQDAARRLK
jgi:hypothetical protein